MPRVPHSTDDLADAELELQRAWLHADVIALEALLDDEVEFFEPGGVDPRGKDEEIEGHRSGRVRTVAFVVERQRVRVIEELGVTDVVAAVAVREHGEVVERRLRFVRSWRLADGWVLVGSHASVARAAPRPGG
ncbi:MAG: nuclear transport factor 2 family protein [Solirubrobacteraceae bacterium]|nr:nuclear transport factor 2 family protein [Patulibacter sp.]